MSETNAAPRPRFAQGIAATIHSPAWMPDHAPDARPLVFRTLDGGHEAPGARIETATGEPAGDAPIGSDENGPADTAPASLDPAEIPSRPGGPVPDGEAQTYAPTAAMAASASQDEPVHARLARDAELQVELEARIQTFSAAILELGALRARALASLEDELIGLALDFAGAIVEREVERDPELHRVMARAALRTLGDPDHARVRVSPAAHEAILEVFPESAVDVDGVRVELEVDASLDGLGCVAHSSRAQVDGRLGERLKAAARAVEDEGRRQIAEEAQ